MIAATTVLAVLTAFAAFQLYHRARSPLLATMSVGTSLVIWVLLVSAYEPIGDWLDGALPLSMSAAPD